MITLSNYAVTLQTTLLAQHVAHCNIICPPDISGDQVQKAWDGREELHPILLQAQRPILVHVPEHQPGLAFVEVDGRHGRGGVGEDAADDRDREGGKQVRTLRVDVGQKAAR